MKLNTRALVIFAAFLALKNLTFVDSLFGQDIDRRIQVLPVFFVPEGERKPTRTEAALLARHLKWSQRRYREMLGGESTFGIEGNPEIYRAKKTLDFYRKQPQGGHPTSLTNF